jgi:membrane protein required for beta-lactamase induction
VLAWVPARLLILGYGLAGSFEGAVASWRACQAREGDPFFRVTNDVLDAVGDGASGGSAEVAPDDREAVAVRVGVAMDMVGRTLWLIWCPAIALMTLTDWLS